MSFLSRLFKFKNTDKSVAAYLYPDKIILISQNLVKDEYWIDTNNFTKLKSVISNEVLGKEVEFLLNKSRSNVPNPKNQKEFKIISQCLKEAGEFKTIKETKINCRYCNIHLKNRIIEFSATINDDKVGFKYFNETYDLLANSSYEEIGKTLRDSWGKCM